MKPHVAEKNKNLTTSNIKITPKSIQKEIKNIMLAGTRKKTDNHIPKIDITKLAKDEVDTLLKNLKNKWN